MTTIDETKNKEDLETLAASFENFLRWDSELIPKLNRNTEKINNCLLDLKDWYEDLDCEICALKSHMETWTDTLNRFSLFDEEYSFQKLMDLEERLEHLEKAAGIDKN